MSESTKKPKKKSALDSFLKKKGKKSKKDHDDKKNDEAGADASVWSVPKDKDNIPAAPKIQVKDLEKTEADVDVKTRIQQEENRALLQHAQKKTMKAAQKKDQNETTPLPVKQTWSARRSGNRPNVNSIANFPSLKANKESEGSEENSEPSKQKKSVWGALVSSDDLEEEEQEEAPKKALGEDVDLVPPIEMEELTRQQMKDRAEPMINDLKDSHEIDHFLNTLKYLRPSEEEFAVDEEVLDKPVYEDEADRVDRPHLALQHGRMLVVENLMESACDWDDGREIVGKALKALLVPQNYDVTQAIEETEELEEALEEPVYLYASLLDRSAVVTACMNVLEFLDDIAVDVPKAADYFAEMLRPLVEVDEVFQKPCIPHKLLPMKIAQILEVDEESKERKRQEEEEKRLAEEERKRKIRERQEEFRRLREQQQQEQRGSRGPPRIVPNPGALKELLKDSTKDKELPSRVVSAPEPSNRSEPTHRPKLNLKSRKQGADAETEKVTEHEDEEKVSRSPTSQAIPTTQTREPSRKENTEDHRPRRPELPCPRQLAEDENPKEILEEMYKDAIRARKQALIHTR